VECIDTSCDLGTSMLETNYSNFIARQLYAQICLKCRKSQYWRTGVNLVLLEMRDLNRLIWCQCRAFLSLVLNVHGSIQRGDMKRVKCM